MATKKIFNVQCTCGKKWRVNLVAKFEGFPEGVALGGAKDPALQVKGTSIQCTCGLAINFEK